MEYMEQQMQNYIEAGITEADRCYARIVELEELNQELAAQVEALKLPLKALLETSLGFGGSLQADGQFAYRVRESVFKKAESALATTPQQHLAEIRAGAVIDAVVSHEVKYGNSQFGRHLREYAANIRQEVK